ncbi:ankyrin repeat domain-containing protein [Cohnella boryungensis]|uniref:Ankyrin repeat domain-containing protein n=1 Tax=Cohnella boryungensis TaxID=768479 RepID=A0ABV8S5V9_9BACL
MYRIANLGKFENLPELAVLIYNGNKNELEKLLKSGMDVEEKLAIGKYTVVTPLALALYVNKPEIAKLFIERGAELNDKLNPAFLLAVRYGDEELVRYLHGKGAKMDRLSRVKSSAYDEAYYGNKHNIPVIRELGLDIAKYGGKTLRKAISDADRKTADYLLDHGVDINYNEPDMVYPYRATPLTVAARMNSMAMVQYLVERGTDVTLAEKDGERAYTIAVTQHNTEMAEYLKSLEPVEFHSRSNKLHALRGYGLPAELIDFLCGDNRRVEIPPNEFEVRFVEFLALEDTVELTAGRQKLLRLSAELDAYSHLLIVWHKGKKGIGFYDIEHKEYGHLGMFADFLNEPEAFLAKMF